MAPGRSRPHEREVGWPASPSFPSPIQAPSAHGHTVAAVARVGRPHRARRAATLAVALATFCAIAVAALAADPSALADAGPTVTVVTASTDMTVISGSFSHFSATAECNENDNGTLIGGGSQLTPYPGDENPQGQDDVPNDGSVTLGNAPSDDGTISSNGDTGADAWTASSGYAAAQPANDDDVTSYALCATNFASSTKVITAQAAGIGPATATCPDDWTLVGGGGGYTAFNGSNNTKVTDSYPSDDEGNAASNDATDPTSWTVQGNSSGTSGATITSYAVCDDESLSTEVITNSTTEDPAAGGSLASSSAVCPTDGLLLDGGSLITGASQGVHMVDDYPGSWGSPVTNATDETEDGATELPGGAWTVTAENGGGSIASLESESFALCDMVTTSLTVPTTASVGGNVEVSWSDVSSPNAGDQIGVYSATYADPTDIADGDNAASFVYAGSCDGTEGSAESSSGDCPSIALPDTAGSYFFVLYDSDGNAEAISNAVNTAPTLSVVDDSTSEDVTPKSGGVDVAWANVTSPADSDELKLYLLSSGGSPTLEATYYAGTCTTSEGGAESSSGSCSTTNSDPITMPTTAGSYDFEFVQGGTAVATSNIINVSAPSISAPSTPWKGATVTVNWTGIESPADSDKVDLYQSGSLYSTYWVYAGSCTQTEGSAELNSGSCSFTLPTATGSYTFEFVQGGSGVVGSGTVTVTAPSITAPASVTPATNVTISFAQVPSPADTDKIELYQSGSEVGSDAIYAGSCTTTEGPAEAHTGSCTFIFWSPPSGDYTVELVNSSDVAIATSGTIDVT